MAAKHEPKPAKLVLEDGTIFSGRAFGATDAAEPVTGEVVFNTSMTGYQEVLTDPSYAGQIVTMTCPHVGNYGTNAEDLESNRAQVAGFVVRELARRTSNYRSDADLSAWLSDQGVLGISEIDTRALTRRLRMEGAMRGALSCTEMDAHRLVELARSSPKMAGRNLAAQVSPRRSNPWAQDLGPWEPIQGSVELPEQKRTVVAIDCGAKANILRNLSQRGCSVVVVPHDTPAQAILDHQPDGVFVSNGPGDPAAVDTTIATLRQLQGRLPLFGICLGHQMLALSMGADTAKLKFGHRGSNQPVQNLATGKVEITSQNHGFYVRTETLEKAGGAPTHINLNDRTLEGFAHGDLPIFAVQYHPEASPGPHDASYLFDCFIEMMRTGVSPTAEQMDMAQRRRGQVAGVGG